MDNSRIHVDKRWKSGWKAHHKNQLKLYESVSQRANEKLEQFIATGRDSSLLRAEDYPGYYSWELSLDIALANYALLKAFDIESTAIESYIFDYDAAAESYAAARLSQLISLSHHVKSKTRIGKQLRTLDFRLVPFAAVGIIIGNPSAIQHAKVLVAAYRHGWYEVNDRYEIFNFMIFLMARFLKEPLPQIESLELQETPLFSLLTQWDNPDPSSIVPMCLAVCDFHTTRCKPGAGMEFSSGQWAYTPVEIMLLMRLRSLCGLKNPEIDHLLWRDVFADIQANSAGYDYSVIDRVEEVMCAQDYDETLIIQNVLNF